MYAEERVQNVHITTVTYGEKNKNEIFKLYFFFCFSWGFFRRQIGRIRNVRYTYANAHILLTRRVKISIWVWDRTSTLSRMEKKEFTEGTEFALITRRDYSTNPNRKNPPDFAPVRQ